MRMQLTASLALTALIGFAAVPAGYYSSLEGKNKGELKDAAKKVARNHKVISYGNETWKAFSKTDTRIVDGKEVWWDMYSPDEVLVSSGHPGMNIEHSVANSWWGGTKNDAYKDLFHLNPSDAEANNWKSNYPLGYVMTVHVTSKGVKQDNGVTKVGKPASGASGNAPWVYEPCDAYKGDMARAFMYIFTIYDDINWLKDSSDRNYMFDGSSYPSFRPWAWELLLEWSRLDPVDTKEINRNEAIYEIQGNRNPFIDCPDLAEYIWGNKQNEGFKYNDNYEPSEPVIPNPVDPNPVDPDPVIPDPVNPDPEPGVEGTWVMVQPGEQISNSECYALVSQNAGAVMSCTLNGKYMNPTAACAVVEDGVIEEMPSGAAILTFSPAEGGYTISVKNSSGESFGYLCSTSAKTMSLSDDATANGAVATVEIDTQGTEITYGAAGKICYNQNKGSERFTTYTSNSMERVNLYRLNETEPTPNAPEIYAIGEDGEECTGEFVNAVYVELSSKDDDTNIRYFYTIDGTDPAVDVLTAQPANSSTEEYLDLLEITESCTLKAVALKGNVLSEISTMLLTKKEPGAVKNINIDDPDIKIFDLTGRQISIDRLLPGVYIIIKEKTAIKTIVR
ncbi:MAG: endonuclease [Prevotella sp.]|nr:endonuclease [Bacteroides sp.]MCM1366380.1 endonuclease [Prevotella sp.]MCM1436691.1 endonuclease [Prevotella sp.]